MLLSLDIGQSMIIHLSAFPVYCFSAETQTYPLPGEPNDSYYHPALNCLQIKNLLLNLFFI